MSRVYLLRHAKAVPTLPGMRDFDRPLDRSGREMAEKLGITMRDNGLIPEKLIASPSLRTRETIGEILPVLPSGIDITFNRALYDGEPGSYLSAITGGSANAASVLIVGHNPMTEESAIELCGDRRMLDALRSGFPTGALAAIDFDQALTHIRPGTGRLAMFITNGRL